MAENAPRPAAQTERPDPGVVLEYKLKAADALAADLKSIFEQSGGYDDARKRVAQFIEEYSAPMPSDRYHCDRLLFHGDGSDINNLMDCDTRAAWPAYFPTLPPLSEEKKAVHGLLAFLPWFVVGGQENTARRPGLFDELQKLCAAYLVERPTAPPREVLILREPAIGRQQDAARGRPAATEGGEQVEGDIPKLPRRCYLSLKTLLMEKAVSADKSMTAVQITRKAEGKTANPESFKRPLSALKKQGYTDSKKGADGGCWLTVKGIDLAKKL
ncbi:MAG TPA: hypothetical protein VMV10_31695 [Pirellulales bacterium]|nr:hypothetical protein [Pirellulales bacterium]